MQTARAFRIFVFLAMALGCLKLGAVPLTLLTLDDGLGNSVSINELGSVTGTGSFSTFGSLGSGPHKTIIWGGTVGQFDLNVTTGRGGASETRPALIDLNSINAASIGAGTLSVLFADTGYTDLAGGLALSVSGSETGGAVGSPVLFEGLARATGSSIIKTIGSLGPFHTSSFSKTETFSNPVGAHGDLGEKVVMSFSGKGDINTSFTIRNARIEADMPEPAGMALLGGALLLLVKALHRKSVLKTA